jgi:hypothetical protein
LKPGGREAVFNLLVLIVLSVMTLFPAASQAQAALLMEEPYGLYGTFNPTGHSAIYFDRICAETPTKLRRCAPGELGAVISRYQGIGSYNWIAIPVIPYFYSVETASEVPAHVDREIVTQMRERYHEAHLLSLGENIPEGNFTHGGWGQLVGVAYERRTYAFRFDTTPEEDDAFIAAMNAVQNHTHFDMFFNNCADFARGVLNTYFPRAFGRSIFPDAGITTPRQITYRFVQYARKHPETQLTIFEISQIPGYRHQSHPIKSVDASLTTSIYVVPIALVNPYLAGGLLLDYIVRGRLHIGIGHPEVLQPDNFSILAVPALTSPSSLAQNPDSAGVQATGAAAPAGANSQEGDSAN